MMTDRRFRFGIVAAYAASGAAWTLQARRAEELGFDTLLVPDTHHTFATPAAMAAAAAATSTLRVGSYVFNTTARHPHAVAHEALSLDTLSDGRLELGLGVGRPGAESEAAARGLEIGTPRQRIDRLVTTVRTVRRAFAQPEGAVRGVQSRPPLLVAGSEPRMLATAVAEADTVAIGMDPRSDEDAVLQRINDLRADVGTSLDAVELTFNLAAAAPSVAELPPALEYQTGTSGADLAAAGAMTVLLGKPTEMADTLRRLRERTGISYVTVNAQTMDALAPVVELLRGT